MDSERRSDRSDKTRSVVRVVFVVAGLCIALGVALVSFTIWQQSRVPDRLESAVRSGFPTFCAGPGETIIIEMSVVYVPLLYDNWDVSCEPERSSAPWPGPAMTVNMGSCVVTRPMAATLEWDFVYGGLFEDGQKMPVCP
ncbi:MAG: hypothetical protein MUO76_14455 [Anaerolineaceae bacterium]|nr:hypothetical protein [Anaerolineaceae bacterium]